MCDVIILHFFLQSQLCMGIITSMLMHAHTDVHRTPTFTQFTEKCFQFIKYGVVSLINNLRVC